MAREAAVRLSSGSPGSVMSDGLVVTDSGPLNSRIIVNGGVSFPAGTQLRSPDVTSMTHLDPAQMGPPSNQNSCSIGGPRTVSQGLAAEVLNSVHNNYEVDYGGALSSNLSEAPRRAFNGGVIAVNSQVDSNGIYNVPSKLI